METNILVNGTCMAHLSTGAYAAIYRGAQALAVERRSCYDGIPN